MTKRLDQLGIKYETTEFASRQVEHSLQSTYTNQVVLDKDIYDLPPEELAKVPQTPGSLRQALHALKADHEFLLKGDVFTEDVISTWIDYKMENEVKAFDLRPHPWEFAMYYDI